MATIAQLLVALQAKEDDLNTQLKVIADRKLNRQEKCREYKRKAYAVKRAAQLADPLYVPKKCGRPFKKSEPQADDV